jgi:hypothetical protein
VLVCNATRASLFAHAPLCLILVAPSFLIPIGKRSGYISFMECDTGDDPYGTPHPTIGIEIGQTYTFNQADTSNYFHPLGFAYFPDGAHDGKAEVEPGGSEGSTGCEATATCPSPMYHATGLGGYLGTYSNDETIAPLTTNETDSGLEHYEPRFYYPMREWLGFGNFSVTIRFDDDTYAKDLFYFCHVRAFEGQSARSMRCR